MLGLASPLSDLYARFAGRYDRQLIGRWIVVAVVSLVLGASTLGLGTLTTRQLFLLFGGLLWFLALLAFGHFKRWLLGIIILDIPFQFDFYVGWDFTVGNYGTIAGLPISLTVICLLILYVLWFYELAITRKPPRFRPRLRSGWMVLPYLGVVALSMVVARNPTLSLYEITLLVQMFFLMVYIGGSTRTKEDVHFLVIVTLLALGAQAVVVILARFNVRLPLVVNPANITDRPTGSFGSPNLAGAYFAFFTPLALAVLFMPVRRLYRLFALSMAALGMVALLFTLSRGAWTAFGVAMIVIVVMTWRRGWLKAWVPIVLILGAIIFVFAFQDIILARLFGDDGGAAAGRVKLVDIAWSMIRDYPVLGIGANNYATVMKDYIGPDLFMSWVYTVHNKYLLVASELGVLGFAAFIFFLASTLRLGFTAWLKEERFLAIVALSLTAAIVGHMFHMQADIFNARASVQMLWVAAAVLSALAAMKSRQTAEDGPPVAKPVLAFNTPLDSPGAPFGGLVHPMASRTPRPDAGRNAGLRRATVRPFVDGSLDAAGDSAPPGEDAALLERTRPDVVPGAPLTPPTSPAPVVERTTTRRVVSNAAAMLMTEVFNRASTFVLYA
ncbi:MAG: O-antigen ligase family protein, partial [Anaerolineae bacterium]|nr:O-antigen ligase family protein [Anaerolineae bacterium]